MRIFRNIVEGSSSTYEWVDLGLPSGLLWASTNVGAENPEDFGLYFAWGETLGYEGITIDKQFTWDDYKFGTEDNLTKYNDTDELTTLELEDDAAYQTDNTCRIPTKDDFEELKANTTQTWETINGVNGMLFTSKADTSKSIFIPAASGVYDGSFNDVGIGGCIWSSSLYSDDPCVAYNMYFYSGGISMYFGSRYIGFSVRAVKSIN